MDEVLQRVGLISRSRRAQWRPCQLEAKPLEDAAAWIEDYRRYWEESFDRLDDLQRKDKATQKKASAIPHRVNR